MKPSTGALHHPLAAFTRWWGQLARREQQIVLAAAAVVALALLWWLTLAPALSTLRSAGQEHARLDSQLQTMQALQEQARALLAQPQTDRNEAMRALETSVRQSLGVHAQLQASNGDAVGVTVRGVPPAALSNWLAEVRSNARALPREVHLTRSQPVSAPAAATAPDAAPAATVPGWDGTLQISLPAAR